MPYTSRISELASNIQLNCSKIDGILLSEGLPSPSFDIDTPRTLPDAVLEPQNALLEAIEELNILVYGPLSYLMNFTINHHNALTSLQAIYRFNIATSFSVNEQVPFAHISQKCGLDQNDTQRLLRHAMTCRIFREPIEGVVAHTPMSKVLAEMPLVREWIGQSCEDMWPAATRVVDAMVKWPGSEEPTHTGFNISNDTQDPIYTAISKDPKRAKRFANAMSFFHSRPGLEISYLLNNYDWAGIGNGSDGVFVDVGGSHGFVSIELAKRFPPVNCIVQDRPEVIKNATIPLPLVDRVKFMEHDFFTEQPIKGADVYFLRWILHNWSDKYAILILKALVPALKHGAKVIVNEFCIPPYGTLSLFQERSVRSFDLAMKEVQNARERNADDWARLFREADPNLRLLEIRSPPSSNLAIIVAGWEGTTSFSAP